MNLKRRLSNLERQNRENRVGELTLEVFRRMCHGPFSEEELRYYGPIFDAMRDPEELRETGPLRWDPQRGVVYGPPDPPGRAAIQASVQKEEKR
jgi:hypothetical protein